MTRSYLGYVSSQTTDTIVPTIAVPTTVEYLVIAGGAGGSADEGAGGGAGGYRLSSVVGQTLAVAHQPSQRCRFRLV
jgi:hypothetical protein